MGGWGSLGRGSRAMGSRMLVRFFASWVETTMMWINLCRPNHTVVTRIANLLNLGNEAIALMSLVYCCRKS